MLRCGWINALVLLWPGEKRADVSNDSVCDEMRCAFGQQSECHMKNYDRFLMKKFWREDILTPTIWIESLYENSDDNASKLCHVGQS